MSCHLVHSPRQPALRTLRSANVTLFRSEGRGRGEVVVQVSSADFRVQGCSGLRIKKLGGVESLSLETLKLKP